MRNQLNKGLAAGMDGYGRRRIRCMFGSMRLLKKRGRERWVKGGGRRESGERIRGSKHDDGGGGDDDDNGEN